MTVLLWTKAFLWILFVHLVQGYSKDPPSGICKKNKNRKLPWSGSCKKYISCDEYELAWMSKCLNDTSFNWLTEKCEHGSKGCDGDKKVVVQQWNGLSSAELKQLKKGEEPQRPALKQEVLVNLSIFDQSGEFQNYGYLLRTNFFAVNNGEHKFTSQCKRWCRVWIKRVDGCYPRKLVLEQQHRASYLGDQYNIAKSINLTFGHFYLLEVVHVPSNQTRTLKVGVQWKLSNGSWEGHRVIPQELLRQNVAVNCTVNRTTIEPTTSTTQLAHDTVATVTSRLSTTKSEPPIDKITSKSIVLSLSQSTASESSSRISSTRGFLTSVSSTTIAPTKISSTTASSTKISTTNPPTVSTTTESPESGVRVLAANVSEFLEPENKTQNPSSSKQREAGLSQVRHVDKTGEFIAKRYNKRGGSLNISRENVVMEVSFPLNNYTFPRPGYTLDDTIEERSDQIFIPARALVNSSGGYNRRVFSALYLNLNKRLPQYFNTVETDEEKINKRYKLNSKVIASTAVPRIHGLKDYDIVINLVHLTTNISKDTELLCVFYKWRDAKNGIGVWSTEGCIRDETLSTRNVSVCRCNHLTHFGILMQMDRVSIADIHTKALRLISYIGCALSLVGASLTVLAIACLPGARSDRNFIHVNLALAISFAQITFLAGIDETENKTICTVVAALLHYFLLAAFSWMLFEGIFLHILIVKVFHDQLPKKRYYVTFCWGLPALIVLLSSNLLRDGYGTETSCWLSTDKLTIWTFMGPAIVVIIINIVILCKVMKEIGSLRTSGRRELTVRTVRDGFRSAIILLPLLGITWALGLICVNGSPITFQYLFAIFNSLQGLFIFLFHCLFNTEVRKAFWRKVDLWFTTHHAFGSNGHSSSKKSKDDHSFSCATNNKTPKGNNSSENSNDDMCDPRKGSSVTTSSYMADAFSPRIPSDTDTAIKGYSGRFSPTLAGINDINFGQDVTVSPMGTDNLKKTSSTPALSEPPKATEDFNGNTHSVDDVCKIQQVLPKRNGLHELPKTTEPLSVSNNGKTIGIGIGGQPVNSVKKIAERLNKNHVRVKDPNKDTREKTVNCNGRSNGRISPLSTSETKL